MVILGIETSCDETAAAVVQNGQILLSNIVASSQKIHQKYGGIVPEIAARCQIEYITPVVREALADIPKDKIDAIAVTKGPGLIGSLLVGVEFAKTLAYLWEKPIVPVNHLTGHIYANWITQNSKLKSQNYNSNLKTNKAASLPSPSYPSQTDIHFPALVLIVSGGHTELVLMKNHGKFTNIGGTRDDAAGEAFDKAARLLNLGYPGGPAIQKTAEKGNPHAFNLPRPLIDSPDFDFSFSGLKTALLREVLEVAPSEVRPSSVKPSPDRSRDEGRSDLARSLTSQEICDLAASFQQAVIDCLINKTLKAAKKYQVKSVLLAGGVAANTNLREELRKAIESESRKGETFSQKVSPFKTTSATSQEKIKFFVPPSEFCTDNAASIASAAFFNYKPISWRKIKVDPGLNI